MFMAIVAWLKHFFAGSLSKPAHNGHDHNGHTNGTALSLPQETASLTNDSYTERAAAWASHAHLSDDAKLSEWEAQIDRWFTQIGPEEQAFLKRILRPACRQAGQNGQTVDTAAPSAKALYRTFMLEGAGDIHFFVRRIVETNTPAQITKQSQLIEDLAKMYGFETAKRVLPLILALTSSHAQNGPALARTPLFVLGTDPVTGQDVELSQNALRHSLFFLGQSGMGKSNAMRHLARYHLDNGHGLILIEPHGQLTRDVIASIPQHRLDEVDLLDLMDCGNSPYGLNVFECDEPGNSTEVAKCASAVFHIFEKTWGMSPSTPLLAQVVRHICYTMIEAQLTLGEAGLLLFDDVLRQKITATISNAHTRLFWEQFNRKSPRERAEYTNSTTNKLDALLTQPLLANILCQKRSTINLTQITREGRILLLLLNQQFEEASRLVGNIVLTKLLLSAFGRAETSQECHHPVALLCDEWQVFCASSSDFARFVHEARKWNFMPCYANQSLSQLHEEDIGAAMSSGTLVALRISGDDARLVSRSMDATPQPVVIGEEPQRAVVSDVLHHLVQRGHNDPTVAAFAMNTLQALEHFLQTPTISTSAKEWHVAYNNGVDGMLILYDQQVQQGRKLLNQTLYACMTEANPNRTLPMLAIYVLASAQRDGREVVFSPYVKHYNHGFIFGPFSLLDFEPGAAKFGEVHFTEPERSARYIAAVTKAADKQRRMALVSMLTELRSCMQILAASPIMVDTGHMVPKYQLRTVSDQQNYVGNFLTQQPPFHARVKTLHGEFTLCLSPPEPIREELVQERIRAIKQRMRVRGVTRPAGEVAEEIRKRHEHLREQAAADDAAPPTSVTDNRRRRKKPTPANT
jgi:hypothetical protein